MKDTAGNEMPTPYLNCNCGLTAGCEKCNGFSYRKPYYQHIHRIEDCSETVEHCLDCGFHRRKNN